MADLQQVYNGLKPLTGPTRSRRIIFCALATSALEGMRVTGIDYGASIQMGPAHRLLDEDDFFADDVSGFQGGD